MIKCFYKRGEDAFPGGCPSCGGNLATYQQPDDEWEEYWEFDCGCAFMMSGGFPEVEEDCPDAMQTLVEMVVTFSDEPAP